MITVKVNDNAADVLRGLDLATREQLPFATALALTRTAKLVQSRLQDTLATAFDRPTPFVLRGTYLRAATKATLSAEIGMREVARGGRAGPAMYVKEFFSGGARDLKPFERALKKMGVLPEGYKAIPGAGLKTDRYGNPDRRALAEIIGALASRISVWSGRGKRQSLTGYFVVPPGARGGAAHFKYPGIFRRLQRGQERAVQSIFIFQHAAQYRKRIDLESLARRVVATDFPRQLSQALETARKTAR